jgi:DNA-binding NtrC family response regulator
LTAAEVSIRYCQEKEKCGDVFLRRQCKRMNRILVVDDHEYIRRLLRAELTLAGYHVTSADSAKRAREYLVRSQPGLVLLGVYLDRPDEVNLLADIKGKYPEVAVIVLTTDPKAENNSQFSEADGCFVKSFDFNGLKRKIAEILRPETHENKAPGGLSSLAFLTSR